MFALAYTVTATLLITVARAATLGPGPAIPASCEGLPAGSLGTLSSNFTLAAYASDGSYIDALVLAPSSLGASNGVSQWVLAVSKIYVLDFFSQADAHLYCRHPGVPGQRTSGHIGPWASAPQPASDEQDQGLAAYANAVGQGDLVSFNGTSSAETPARIYCDAVRGRRKPNASLC